jgi:hypothetical protein
VYHQPFSADSTSVKQSWVSFIGTKEMTPISLSKLMRATRFFLAINADLPDASITNFAEICRFAEGVATLKENRLSLVSQN